MLNMNGLASKESTCNAADVGSIPGLGKFPEERKCQLTTVFLPGKSHGQRILVGYSPWGFCQTQLSTMTYALYICSIHTY